MIEHMQLAATHEPTQQLACRMLPRELHVCIHAWRLGSRPPSPDCPQVHALDSERFPRAPIICRPKLDRVVPPLALRQPLPEQVVVCQVTQGCKSAMQQGTDGWGGVMQPQAHADVDSGPAALGGAAVVHHVWWGADQQCAGAGLCAMHYQVA